MVEFRRDGVNKLTGTVDDLLGSGNSFHSRLKKIVNASSGYKSFSGIPEGMDGSVKFIMSTSAVTAEEEE